MTSLHLIQAFIHVWNQDHLIHDQLVARNVSDFLWQQFTYPLRSLHILSSGGSIQCFYFLNPTHAACLTSHGGWEQQALLLILSSDQFNQNRAIVASSTASELSQNSGARLLSDNSGYLPDSIIFKKTRIRNLGDGILCICNSCSKNPLESWVVGWGEGW